MGRNAQPISIIMMNGKSHHITKDEKKRRENNKIEIGIQTVEAPEYVKSDKTALKQWQKLMSDYEIAKEKGHEIITSTDADILGKYCVTHSEYLALKKKLQIIDDIDLTELHDDIQELDDDIKKKLNKMLNVDYSLKLESAINKKHEILIKLEDRLFLNPLSKIKNIAKKEKEKPKNSFELDFDI